MTEFAHLGRDELLTMAAMGGAVARCEAALARSGGLLAVALGGERPAAVWEHYPEGDVYDPETHAQYFYHSHPPDPSRATEHGHFHTFLRAGGMPANVRPLLMPELAIADHPAAPHEPLPSAPRPAPGEDADPWSHLVAIALDGAGRPFRLFTTNRWVTGETWYAAADVAQLIGRFRLEGVGPSPELDRWVASLLGLYRPAIRDLLLARDAAVMGWRRRRRGKVHVLEDRRLEVTSALDIDVEADRRRIDAVLEAAAKGKSSILS